MLCVRTYFLAQISDIVNTCQNNRLECRTFLSGKVVAPKLRQKVQKYLVVACTVNFVYDKYNGLS